MTWAFGAAWAAAAERRGRRRRLSGGRSLTALKRTHGELPRTATVETGGGRHSWFAHLDPAVRNSAGRLGPGVDIRGDGGYAIAPPSCHITGRRYRWGARRPLAPLPRWIVELTRERDHPTPAAGPERVTAGPPARPWARAALTAELGRVRSSIPGSRNHTLNRAAFALGQLVGSGSLPGQDVREAILDAGLSCGLTPREVLATVASGLKAGIRLPRHPRAPDIHPR